MAQEGLGELDRAILHALQRNARRTSSGDIAEEVGVAASTVRNHIRQLESRGVVEGYRTVVDYEQVGYPLYTLVVCRAPIPVRGELASAAADVPGVVRVQEVMTGTDNVLVSVVARDRDDLNRVAGELIEVGLDVVDEHLIRTEHETPFAGFDPERSDEDQ